MSAALTGALTELGVTVGYQLTDVTSEADGEESYRVELRRSAEVEAVEVRGARVVHRCVDPADGSVRAWVAVPEAEWLELARVLRGRTALVLECAGAASDLCETPATLAPLRAAASELELDLLPGLRRAGESTEAAGLCEIGVKEGAARVLHVRLDARDDAADYGEHFAWASAHAHLYETRDCTRQRSAAPEEVKGAQFSAAEARKAALARAVERLVEEMRGW